MSITTVRGTAVDCHTCRATTQHPDAYAAHAFAAVHANQHMQPAPVQQPAQQVVVSGGPRYAKTTINHTPHIILDVITLGFWIPVHITLAILGGRKTRIR